MAPNLRQFVYTSTATHPRGHLSDVDILKTATARNEKLGLSGYLFRTERRFIQVLEGPGDVVAELVRHIALDRRHFEMKILVERDIEERMFASWSMGYHEFSEEEYERLTRQASAPPENAPSPLIVYRLRERITNVQGATPP